MKVPFFRPFIGPEEIAEVTDTLKSGWLTTGPKTKQFELEFARYVGAEHAVALNSATAALHLALEAIGTSRGDAVLVPTMTFAATAEVVRYFDARPLLIDCREDDFNLDLDQARRVAKQAKAEGLVLRAIIPVHYGGQAADMPGVVALAREFGMRVIEDAAHCCPAAYRQGPEADWVKVGAESDICCYSFYANKCITTGEGGMACTNDHSLASRMRVMALHGISSDAWKRFSAAGTWYYEIIAPGYKYNLTDIASALGLQQLRRADEFRRQRAHIAQLYTERLSDCAEIVLPRELPDRQHSWHLFEIRLQLGEITLDRAAVIEKMKSENIGLSVHWIPLHMHPYYRETYGYKEEDYPVASRVSREIISLPIFPSMRVEEVDYVADTLKRVLASARK